MIVKTNLDSLRAAFFDKAGVAFVLLDKDFNFIDANEELLEELKLRRDQIAGKNIRELSPGIEHTKRFKLYQHVMRTGYSTTLDEVKVNTKLGKFSTRIKVFKVGEGIGVSALDITDLTNTMDQLDKTKEELVEANINLEQRNRELEEFSFVAAHDLKVPLTNLRSLIKMLNNDKLIPEVKKKVFFKMEQVVAGMETKLNALNNTIAIKLDLSREKEWVNVATIINKVKINFAKQINEAGIVIKHDCSELPLIEYCPIQLYSIIYHLLDNAIKFKRPKHESLVELRTKEENGKPILMVSDNGLGFNQKIGSKKVFGLFKRMHTHVDGLGVGLYVVKYMVVAHGGTIEVNSKINEGTSFKLCLEWKK